MLLNTTGLDDVIYSIFARDVCASKGNKVAWWVMDLTKGGELPRSLYIS